MNRKTTCRLVAALRLAEGQDGIGVPVYGSGKENALYIGETDYDLRITRFVEFLNEGSYPVDYSIIDGKPKIEFSISEFGPIPYFNDGIPGILSGGITVDAFDDSFGSLLKQGGVFADLRRIICNSRTGYYESVAAAQQAGFFQTEYTDIFERVPVHSKYWVSRYRSGVLGAEKLQPEVANEVWPRLRERALSWIDRFSAKGDLRFLTAILETSEGRILSAEEVSLIYFHHLAKKLANWSFTSLKLQETIALVERRFPNGLYGFYLNDLARIVRVLGNRNTDVKNFEDASNHDFLSAFAQHLAEFRISDKALLSSILIFGNLEMPTSASEAVSRLFGDRYNTLTRELRFAFESIFKRTREDHEWANEARRLLREIELLNLIDRIRSPSRRIRGDQREPPFIEEKVVADLRRFSRMGKSPRGRKAL